MLLGTEASTTQPSRPSLPALVPAAIKPGLNTPLRPGVFALLLSDHPDKQFVQRLCDMLRYGANIGYCGPIFSQSTPNSKSVTLYPKVVSDYISNEVALGHSRGPFPSPPLSDFVTSALGVVQKKSGGYRLIMDLSRPISRSVNDFIDRDCYSIQYCRFDDAVRLLIQAGPGALMAKQDVKAAFRLIPVREEDHHLLGFCFNNSFYYDLVLSFGLRSSPFLWCMVADAVHWIFTNVSGNRDLCHYMDDYWFCGPANSGVCESSVKTFTLLCGALGLPLAANKAEGPASVLTFLGICLNSVTQTMSLPPGKLNEIMDLLASWSSRVTCKKRELQSIIGSLYFASVCVPAGRLYVRRMIALLST
jgi:hypothetical protein